MNRRQLLALGGLTVAAPHTMASPGSRTTSLPPAPAPAEIRIAVLDPGKYVVRFLDSRLEDDKLIVRMQLVEKAPIEYITLSFLTPEKNN